MSGVQGARLTTLTGVAKLRSKNEIDWFPYFVGAVSLSLLVVFLVYPIGKTTLLSFIQKGDELAFGNLTFVNFGRFFDASTYRDALVHSIWVSSASALCAVVLAVPAAYALVRVAIPFRNFILALSVVPLIMPPFIGAYAWGLLLGRRGVMTHFFDAWFGFTLPTVFGPFGIILTLTLHYFPFVFLIAQGALSAADPYIEECAQVMGANRWRIMRSVTFPLIVPAIGAGALVVFVESLGNFGVPAVLGGEYQVLPTLVYYQITGFFNFNAAAAIGMVSVMLTLIVVLILLRVNQRRRFITVTSVTRRVKRDRSLTARILANAYIWLLLLLAILPNMVVVAMSFVEKWAGTLFPTAYGLGNYRAVRGDLLDPIINSLLLSGGATILCVVFGTVLAYASVRNRFYGKWALDMTIMLPFVLPGIVTGVAYLTTFNTGLVVLSGTAWIIIMAFFIGRLPYVFRSVSAAISQLDDRMEEASTICGATWAYTNLKVTVPLTAPAVLAGGILVFSTLITEMSMTIILYSPEWQTIAIAIFKELTNDNIPAASTFGAIAIFMTLGLVFSASKLIGKNMADMFR